MYKDNVKKLPDAYYKGKDGNNYKLLHLNELSAQVLDKDMSDVLNSLDIEQATGATLDLYGQMLGQERGSLNDYQYRLVIKNKIAENMCQGDFNSVLELLSQIFDCDVKDIAIQEVATNKIDIKRLSLKALSKAGFTGEQAIEMVERILPVCVKVNSANIEGTFEFGDTQGAYEKLNLKDYSTLEKNTYQQITNLPEYDENKGFGNIEQTIGGYFGLVL